MKLKSYIFLAVYLLSCAGIILNFHYCNGSLEAIALFHIDGDECCGDEDEKNCPCCDDKFISADTDDSESSKKTIIQSNDLVKKIASRYQLTMVTLPDGYWMSENIIPINHAPPNADPEPLFIKNCIMRI